MSTVCVAHLKAAPEYIEFLRQAFRSPDLYMTETPHGNALVIKVDANGLSSTDAWNQALAVVRRVLGSLNAFSNLIGPISVVAPVSAADETGKAETTGATLEMRLRIFSREGRDRLLEVPPNGSETLISRIVRLASVRPEVSRALALLEDRDPSWSDIYLLMEIVEVSLREPHPHAGKDWTAIAAQAWLPKSIVGMIKRNAGYHRHAKLFQEPRPPMLLQEAQRYCKIVVRSWVEKLAAS